MTEDAEYIWKVTWCGYSFNNEGKENYDSSYSRTNHVKAFTNKREALMFACAVENSPSSSNVKVIKWFGD